MLPKKTKNKTAKDSIRTVQRTELPSIETIGTIITGSKPSLYQWILRVLKATRKRKKPFHVLQMHTRMHHTLRACSAQKNQSYLWVQTLADSIHAAICIAHLLLRSFRQTTVFLFLLLLLLFCFDVHARGLLPFPSLISQRVYMHKSRALTTIDALHVNELRLDM